MAEASAEVPLQAGFDSAGRGTTRGAKKKKTNHLARLETGRSGFFFLRITSAGFLAEFSTTLLVAVTDASALVSSYDPVVP